ncbi:hypothetical protein [Rhodococcus sovatensis]|uniref:DUF202 domain-containing protein n=1 Tax=Rhodococcus sovatensis TaxID=1805840 RepID=A0ABZ2PHE7_9NOCA
MGRAESGIPRPPGLGTLTMTAMSVLGLLAMRYDVPATLSGMTAPDEMLTGLLLMGLMVVAGASWWYRTMRVLEQQRWSWRCVDSPLVVLTGAAVYLLIPPGRQRTHGATYEDMLAAAMNLV